MRYPMDNEGALKMLRQWQRRVQAAALRFGPKDEVPFDPLDPKKRKLMPHQVAESVLSATTAASPEGARGIMGVDVRARCVPSWVHLG